MRGIVGTLFLAFAVSLSSCAPQDDEARRTSEAGGTIPWNKPAGWEGPGVLGSQISQQQGGSGGF
jgi:hypothetical protein